MTNLSLFSGEHLKERGMERAVAHADAEIPSWSDRAYELLVRFPRTEYMTEDLRAWAYANGLPKPPDEKAWGGVMAKARRAKVVEFAGWGKVKNPKAHGTPAAVWKKSQ